MNGDHGALGAIAGFDSQTDLIRLKGRAEGGWCRTAVQTQRGKEQTFGNNLKANRMKPGVD